MNIPFWLTTFVILLMILLYTFEGGVKTIVFTDTLQTTFMLLGLIVCVVYIMNNLDYNLGTAIQQLENNNLTRIFNTDPDSSGFWLKANNRRCIYYYWYDGA